MNMGDLARKAGVSKTVISAIINDKVGQGVYVSEKKRKEILALIKKHNYVPHKSARALSLRKSNNIAFIIHSLTPYFAQVWEELLQVAYEHGLEVITYITENSDEKEEEYFNLLRDGRVDGILTCAFTKTSPERYERYAAPPYNLKIMSIGPQLNKVPSVYFDGTQAGKIAAEHLVQCGCKQLCFAGGELDTYPRYISFAETAKTHNLPEPERFHTQVESFSLIQDGIRTFFDRSSLPDGIFAYNDIVGVAIIREANLRGIKIPEQLKIIGHDNTGICNYPIPTLTSLVSDIRQTAEVAVKSLVAMINNRKPDKFFTKIPVKLVKRNST